MRDATARAADWTWDVVRRIHLGTRRPANWVQLFKFGRRRRHRLRRQPDRLRAPDRGGLGVHHIAAAVGGLLRRGHQQLPLEPHWTFRATDGHAGFQAARFFTVSLVALGVNLVVLEFLIVRRGRRRSFPRRRSPSPSRCPVNFVGNKLWTFS